MTRNKAYTFINILGLVVGISFSCMLYLYVSNELSYDSFHAKSDRIFRAITIDKTNSDDPRSYGVSVPPLGKELLDNYPEVEDMVRMYRFVGHVSCVINGESFLERNWYTVDSNFFSVFDFEFVRGDKATALKEPYSVVITQSTAQKYFGDSDPVGQVIEKCNFGTVSSPAVKVTAVIKDLPDNSHLQFDLIFSSVQNNAGWTEYLNSWNNFSAYTYLVLKDNISIENLRAKMPALQRNKFGDSGNVIALDFQPIEDIYLGSEKIAEGAETSHGQINYIYIFSSMGIFLSLIACINYINLATSRAMSRSREVGVRKVAGARKNQLIVQFLTESSVITIVSMILAVGVMAIAFPYFNEITGKQFEVTADTMKTYFPPLFCIALVVGIISGSYPAFYLSTLKPVSSLKGKNTGERGAVGLRKTLVVFQFALTIVMLVSMIVIGRQLNFIQNKDIGFNKDQLLIIDINSGDVRRQFQAMKNEYLNIPGVQHVAVSSRVPGEWKDIQQLYVKSSASSDGVADSVMTYFMGFDEDMMETYKLRLATGRYFSANNRADSTTILLNQSAVKALDLVNPIGSIIKMNTNAGVMNATVIGVIKDFNFQSLHQKIAPIIIGTWNNPFNAIDYFTLKVSGDPQRVIQPMTRVHEKFDQRSPIEYHFLDQQLQSFYVSEKRVAMIFRMGGGLSIFVACLGLFGLATYNIERRKRELGIRKVLGASEMNLFIMLSSSFTKQIGIAYLIASPLAYYIMDQWLKIFEYKISLNAGIFLVSGAIALIIALATISYRSLKAAYANPVDSLRQE